MMGWQWHQLDHMQILCTSLQTDNHASTSPLTFYSPDALPAAQPTASKHWRHYVYLYVCCIKSECLFSVKSMQSFLSPVVKSYSSNNGMQRKMLSYISKQHSYKIYSFVSFIPFCLQCFDTVGWAAGRASGL